MREMYEEDDDESAEEGSALLTVVQGTTADLGPYRVGLMNVLDGPGRGGKAPRAQLSVWAHDPAVAGLPSSVKVGPTIMYLGRGDIAPVGGALRRVAEVVRRPASGEPDYMVMDMRPLDLPGLAPAEAAYVVTLEGKGVLEGHNVEVLEIKGGGAAPPSAGLNVWPGNFAKSDVDPKLVRALEVRGGETLTLGDARFRVASVVAPDPARGLVGWIEISLRPEGR